MDSSDRFFCPFPGCNRSFIDLWRLKVHYRADPDIRGSGRERGHGSELPACPKCNKTLERGRHHVRCAAGRVTPSQKQKKLSETDNENKNLPPPKRLRSANRHPELYPTPETLTAESPWPSGNMLMMPCSIRKGYIFSAESDREVKLISGHAFFLPCNADQKAFFVPLEALQLRGER